MEKTISRGLDAIIQEIEIHVKNTSNPYLTAVDIETGRWFAGASHCTIRDLMKNDKLPSIKVGVAFKAHYLDVIEYVKLIHEQKSL